MDYDRENNDIMADDVRDKNSYIQQGENPLNENPDFSQTGCDENDGNCINDKSGNCITFTNDYDNKGRNKNESIELNATSPIHVNLPDNPRNDDKNDKTNKGNKKEWKNNRSNNNINNGNSNINNSNNRFNNNNGNKKKFGNANNNNNNNSNNNNDNNNDIFNSENNKNNNNNKNFNHGPTLFNTTTFFPNDGSKGFNNNNNRAGGSFFTNMVTGTFISKHEIIKKIFKLPLDYLGLKKVSKDPYDSFILRLHYRFGFSFFLLAFLLVWCNVLNKKQIHCIGIDAKEVQETKTINICLSYSTYTMPDGRVKQILFYRWSHFAFLLVSGGMILMKLPARRFSNARVRNLFFHLSKNATKIESFAKENGKKAIVSYFKENLGTHMGFFYMYHFNHIFAAVVSIVSFWFLDVTLQGHFLSLLTSTYPFGRDPIKFQDPLSLIFPPFVTCVIGPGAINMLSGREDTFHCYLPLMEFYEKVFICAWVILASMIAIELGSVCVLGGLPFAKKFLLKVSRKKFSMKATTEFLLKNLNFGDIFLLFLVKELISEKHFSEALMEIEVHVKHLRKIKIV